MLVYANKQDISTALTQAQVAQALDLPRLRDRKWQIQACSALKGTGINEGMEWLLRNVSSGKKEKPSKNSTSSSSASSTSAENK